MPLCHNCDFEVAENTGFCPMCGVAQKSDAPIDISGHVSAFSDPDELMAKMFDENAEEVSSESDKVVPAEERIELDETPEELSHQDENPELEIREEQLVAVSEEPEHPAELENFIELPADRPSMGTEPEEGPENAEAVVNAENSAEDASFEADLEDEQQPKVSTNDFAVPASESLETELSGSDLGQTEQPLGSITTDGKRGALKPLAEGTLLNSRYKIVRKIGGGGMGAVYLACDQNLGGIERAVKEMVQSSIEEEQQNKAVEDFKRESTILSTLDHPSIPTIYDYFFDNLEGRFYLVMKYISGGDLAARLRSTPGGRIDERTVTEWAIQVADVLSYLHNLPTTIVYRDLKPSNIMLDGTTGKVMLIDFGIARSINQQEKGVTAVGTMGYAPPELFSGQVEPRSDIYSLGSTMFHLLTGADPQNNPLLIFDFQKNPRPRQINPQLSDQMERILMRSVEYSAEHRFPSADAMRRSLAEHLDHLRSGQITFGVSEAPMAVSLENQTVFCGFCGQRIVATDMFCAFCGAKQPIGQQGVHAEIYPRTGVTAKLLIDGTSELDTPVFSLEKNENLLGRRDPQSNIFPEVDLSKFDPQTKISRRHARIWREGGGFMVEDLGSSNGTILVAGLSDSVRLQPRQPHPLTSGDRLRLGDTTLHFLMS
ncbi:MAG: protein kinase [Acidobacteria bacterium]|nr:protein kinase [Acidobacteriota bacterium]